MNMQEPDVQPASSKCFHPTVRRPQFRRDGRIFVEPPQRSSSYGFFSRKRATHEIMRESILLTVD
jgi:hypothetical protein